MKYQVVLLGTPWNKKELTHGVLSLPGLSLVELDELNMNRPFCVCISVSLIKTLFSQMMLRE